MWDWFSKKEKEALMLTETTETMLPIPFASAAKQMSIDNLDKRIKRAEKAIFDEACRFINEQIEEGYLAVGFDAFTPVYRIDDTLDKNSIFVAIDECINHLSTFGYAARRDGERRLVINWQYPKEITLNDIEWSI
jgi:hypothetical protein